LLVECNTGERLHRLVFVKNKVLVVTLQASVRLSRRPTKICWFIFHFYKSAADFQWKWL